MEDHVQDTSSQPSHGSETERNEPVRSRWTPKPEQILILESIFNSGMVNPPKNETVRIRKLLERFGSVGDANIFYWFQNWQSRSRRRKRQIQTGLAVEQQQTQASSTGGEIQHEIPVLILLVLFPIQCVPLCVLHLVASSAMKITIISFHFPVAIRASRILSKILQVLALLKLLTWNTSLVQGMHCDVSVKPSIWREALRIVNEEGFRAFWKGNLVTIAHRHPYSLISFYAYERYKNILKSITGLDGYGENASVDVNVDNWREQNEIFLFLKQCVIDEDTPFSKERVIWSEIYCIRQQEL